MYMEEIQSLKKGDRVSVAFKATVIDTLEHDPLPEESDNGMIDQVYLSIGGVAQSFNILDIDSIEVLEPLPPAGGLWRFHCRGAGESIEAGFIISNDSLNRLIVRGYGTWERVDSVTLVEQLKMVEP